MKGLVMFKIVYVIDGEPTNNEVFGNHVDAENSFYFMVFNPHCVSTIMMHEDKIVQSYYVNKAVPMGGWSEGKICLVMAEQVQ